MENVFGGIVNFFHETLDFTSLKTNIFLSELDVLISKSEQSLHGKSFGPILTTEFLTNFNNYSEVHHNEDDFWPSSPRFCKWIGIDYGRSHYFFTEEKDTIPLAVHENIFGNSGNKTNEEMLEFFSSLGLNTTEILTISSSITPTRSNLLARVKFEMLKNYFVSKGKTEEESRKISLIGMGITTQHGLKIVKFKICETIVPDNADLRRKFGLSFCFFQTNFFVDPNSNEAKVSVTFINYVPTSGCWQSHALLTNDNIKKIRACFVMSLEKEGDLGEAVIHFEGDNPHHNKKLDRDVQLASYGIFNANLKKVVQFRDTSPTW